MWTGDRHGEGKREVDTWGTDKNICPSSDVSDSGMYESCIGAPSATYSCLRVGALWPAHIQRIRLLTHRTAAALLSVGKRNVACHAPPCWIASSPHSCSCCVWREPLGPSHHHACRQPGHELEKKSSSSSSSFIKGLNMHDACV